MKLFSLSYCIAVISLAACGKKEPSKNEATIADMERAFQSVSMAQGKQPEKIEDLSEFLTLQGLKIPAAPAGKKYVIDPAARTVVLTNQ